MLVTQFPFLELGVIPAPLEVDILKLTFLHHILTLEDDDPVKLTYMEQLKIPEEKNWANEVKNLRSMYQIKESDREVLSFTKEEWKVHVTYFVRTHALATLNKEKNNLSKSSSYPDALYLHPAKYLFHFTARHACLLFRVRCRIVDVKDILSYKYEDSQMCRSCNSVDETLNHVLCECPALTSECCSQGDEYSENMNLLEKVIHRIEEFLDKVDEEDEEGENDEDEN